MSRKSALFQLFAGMLATIMSPRSRATSEERHKQASEINRMSGGMMFGQMLTASPYNQRQRRKRMRQNPCMRK